MSGKNTRCQIKKPHPRLPLSGGRLLLEQKNALKHGQWLPWLRDRCSEIPERSAQRYLFVAKHWDLLQSSWRPDPEHPGQMEITESGSALNYSLTDAERAIRDLQFPARMA